MYVQKQFETIWAAALYQVYEHTWAECWWSYVQYNTDALHIVKYLWND